MTQSKKYPYGWLGWLLLPIGLFLLWRLSQKNLMASVTTSRNKWGAMVPVPWNVSKEFTVFEGELSRQLNNAGYGSLFQYWRAVALFETGGFGSGLVRDTFNMWGMGVPTVRQSARVTGFPDYIAKDAGNNRKFSVYSTMADAVRDIILYSNARKMPKSFDNYAQFVNFLKSKGYFEISAVDYFNRSKKYLEFEFL
jgi:hypothetical protein